MCMDIKLDVWRKDIRNKIYDNGVIKIYIILQTDIVNFKNHLYNLFYVILTNI